MKDTLFEFAEAVLKGRDLIRKVESAEQACGEAEARLKKLAEKESEAAANLAKAEKQAKRIADSLLEQAEKKASGIIQEAEDHADAVRRGLSATLEDSSKEVDSLAKTKSDLTAELSKLRAECAVVAGQKDQLVGIVASIKEKLGNV